MSDLKTMIANINVILQLKQSESTFLLTLKRSKKH